MKGIRADIVLLGHTHLPMIRGAWTKVVVNSGSVGQPLDGDPRASYALIQDGVVEIRRVAYDIEATVGGIRDMGLSEHVAKALMTLLRTGKPLLDRAAEEGGERSAKPGCADAIETIHHQ